MDTQHVSQAPAKDRSIYLAPGAGNALQFGATERFVWKATGTTTNGVVDTGELIALPHAAPPEHIHWRNDESFYVLEGTFTIKVGAQYMIASTEAFVFVPRGTPHAWRNSGPEPGRMLLTFTPGGVDQYFAAVALVLGDPPDMDRLVPVLQRHGVELVGPPLTAEPDNPEMLHDKQKRGNER